MDYETCLGLHRQYYYLRGGVGLEEEKKMKGDQIVKFQYRKRGCKGLVRMWKTKAVPEQACPPTNVAQNQPPPVSFRA